MLILIAIVFNMNCCTVCIDKTKINLKVHDQKSSLVETGKSENPTIECKDEKNLKKNRFKTVVTVFFTVSLYCIWPS